MVRGGDGALLSFSLSSFLRGLVANKFLASNLVLVDPACLNLSHHYEASNITREAMLCMDVVSVRMV